ncbi:UDP-3-O-(3-hydroxymyristoyl)glucosamine N-acyltransferase [Candidatus Pelagibacter sp. HIMB1321]|uniref:UDP-3-O-(3-hydroxymyristoyl)glucosamine N-acyltransferase n=1 Tax=Candidatus Pelagibacter sp. HIMB1321 TaxID=1388755 RepID=UPI000A080D94|nr:UDP-3-O-(3-hydroxymyristoyl)glucosamine N-acyltransferase [Candidatus Pelagibacter sp. HIMB1321]SMF74783.1 UDP-3-O-[3-hydroxymyristoyl] glucosamine N-acyltransferase [Candidatus Pelagibacter sp. HIMB1321]
MSSAFFKNNGPYTILEILNCLNIKIENEVSNRKINDIKDLFSSNENDITFFHSKKYKDIANKTKASFCITTDALRNDLPETCTPLIVDNVLFSTSKLTAKFYPDSINDDFDNSVTDIFKTEFADNVKYGKNVLIGKNISIGSNCLIGHNTIIEKNVSIGDNCSIGSNTIIRNSIIKNNVRILDNCVLGKHGFGFFPLKKGNLRYPHIGIVLIEDNCEIGCGSTIDRGSMSNTVIGKNTYLDNQIHIAHNVKIGDNSIIAGQVGIAGSSVIGNNVKIGGQAGISGHLKIGNNVEIAGGSGVIKDIPDNAKVMGYPAKNIRKFLKDNK